MNQNTVSCSFPVARHEPKQAGPKAPKQTAVGPSRAARLLALAHNIEAQIEAGEVGDYAQAARALGLTRARLTQVMKLVLLAPEIQERILAEDYRVTERRLRRVVGEPDWSLQLALCAKVEKP